MRLAIANLTYLNMPLLEGRGIKKANRGLKCRPQRPVLTASDYRKLQFCLHPDRVAAFNDAGITARYTEAFKWLAGMKDAVAD